MGVLFLRQGTPKEVQVNGEGNRENEFNYSADIYLINIHVSNACSVPASLCTKTERVPAHKPLTFCLGGQAEKNIIIIQISCRLTFLWIQKQKTKKHMKLIILSFYCCPCKIPFKYFWDTSRDKKQWGQVTGHTSPAPIPSVPAHGSCQRVGMLRAAWD